MSSVLSRSHCPISTSKEGTCWTQSLTCDCFPPHFCKSFTKSSEESFERDIRDIKVVAQNNNNANVIEDLNGSNKHTVTQPRKYNSDVSTNGLVQKNSSSLFHLTLCGNRSFKDEIDPGETPYKAKHMYSYRVVQKDMKVEKNRLETFKNVWPLSYIDPSDLAAVGFFYLQCGDKVQCAFCRGIIVDWAPGDDPLTEHALHFPLCPFLLNRDVGNVPISGKNLFLDSFNNSHPENSEISRPTSRAPAAECSSASHPKFIAMKSREKRFSTFKNWQYRAVAPDTLVEAGFFYTGTEDIVACFHCGGTLGHWDIGDDPWLEHKKHFSHCTFLKSASCSTAKSSTESVLQNGTSEPVETSPSSDDIMELMKSEVFMDASKIFSEKLVRDALERQLKKKHQGFQSLEDLCSTILEIQDETQKKSNTEAEPQHEAKSAAASLPGDRHMCKICWDKEMGIVFLPCGHMVACPQCAQSVATCPLCRRTIEDRIRAYMS